MPIDDLSGSPARDDHSECCKVIASYGPAVDWIDSKTLLRIFWPGAILDFGQGFFTGPVEHYVDTVIECIERSYIRRMHNAGLPQVIVRGDRAWAENAATNQTLSRDPSGTLTLSTFTARYFWRLERRSECWRISAMKFLLISVQQAPYDRDTEIPGLNLAERLDARDEFFV